MFTGKTVFAQLTIGNHVRILGEYTFSYLPITSVTIPGNVRTIENNVFNGCEDITSITFEAGQYPLSLGYDTEFDDSDYGVGRGPFLNAPNINTVVLNRNINYSFGGEVDADTYNSVIRASIFYTNTLYKISVPAESVDAYRAAWPTHYYIQIQAITE